MLSDGKVLERLCLGWQGDYAEALARGEVERRIEVGLMETDERHALADKTDGQHVDACSRRALKSVWVPGPSLCRKGNFSVGLQSDCLVSFDPLVRPRPRPQVPLWQLRSPSYDDSADSSAA